MKKFFKKFIVVLAANFLFGCASEAKINTKDNDENVTTILSNDENSESVVTVSDSTNGVSKDNTTPLNPSPDITNPKEIDLYDWKITANVDKKVFANFTEGSEIIITTTKSKRCTFTPWEYYNLKLYAPTNNGWSEIKDGSIKNATYNGVIVPNSPNGTIIYTVTKNDAESLKKYGLVMNGYGLCITELKVVVKSNSSSSNNQNKPTENTVWSGSKEFNDTSWEINLQITADKFSSFKNGSQIKIEWSELSGASYKKLQLDSMGSNWNELTGGTISGGEKEVEHPEGYALKSSPTIYTVTESNASALKQNGLVIMGYGAIVTKITLFSEGGATGGNSNGNNSSDNSNSSNNGENQKPTTPDTSDVETKVEPTSVTGTPYANHGKLSVKEGKLVDKNGKPYMLYGMSTHGLNFGNDMSRYVNADAFKTLVDEWNTNCIRLVMYPRDYNGYCAGGNQSQLKQIIKDGIKYATEKGMYVLVDWHVHQYNPNETKNEAKSFLAEFSKEYANYGNVLYEICNEPTGSPWNSVLKPYAEDVIPVIRKNAPDSVIIVGTNTWSQDIEEPLRNPLSFKNVMYTFHFYAQTHQQSYRDRVENCIKQGLPVFITEFGTCDASGNGGFNANESQKWFDLCKKYNISHLNWSLCNKGETASAIQSWCQKTSAWSDSELTESGKLVKKHFKTLTR